jgi:hypothetical protein
MSQKWLGLDSEIFFFQRRRFTRLAINKVSQSDAGFKTAEIWIPIDFKVQVLWKKESSNIKDYIIDKIYW